MRPLVEKHDRNRTAMGFVSLLLIVTVANSLFAQEKPAPNRADSEGGQRDYRFEVVSIRPTDPQGPGKYGTMQPFTPGRYHQERLSLAGLAIGAFEIKHGYQMRSPDWMSKAWFSVSATVPQGVTKDDVPIMLRHLLEDRFALKYHQETRQMDGYELIVAKPGPKLTISSGPPDKSAVKGMGIDIKDGVPQFDKNTGPQQLYVEFPAGLVSWWHGRDETMQRLASDISNRVKAPVMDATGLEGKYDFSLNFIGEPSASADASVPAEYAPLPVALREQLGLELRPVKNVPIDVIVIDSANQVPTEN